MTAFPEPRRWSAAELDEARLLAIGDFITGRTGEGDASYAAFLAEATAGVERLLVATDDLTALGSGEMLMADVSLVAPLRFTAGPPVAEAVLAVTADVPEKPTRLTAAQAERIALLLTASRDRARFPWLDAAPPTRPDPAARLSALVATATLWASQRMATKRRTEGSRNQEASVRAYLASIAFTQVPTLAISAPDDLARGTFCAETEVVGSNADISVRAHNGRLLLIECKVSGSAVNSVKRLNREVGDKVATWSRAFGTQQHTMAVLAGVFRLKNLTDAQAKNIAIVWERDLAPLAAFLAAAV
jgi:XamI restriction endonuclease